MRNKNYIKISRLEKGEIWTRAENDRVSIFIPEYKFEEIKNLEINR